MIKINEEDIRNIYYRHFNEDIYFDKKAPDSEKIKQFGNAAFLASLYYLDKADEAGTYGIMAHNAIVASSIYMCGFSDLAMDIDYLEHNIGKRLITDAPQMYKEILSLGASAINILYTYGIDKDTVVLDESIYEKTKPIVEYKKYLLEEFNRFATLAEENPEKYGEAFFRCFDESNVGDALVKLHFMNNDKIPTIDDIESMTTDDYGPDFNECKNRVDAFIEKHPEIIKNFFEKNKDIAPTERLSSVLD